MEKAPEQQKVIEQSSELTSLFELINKENIAEEGTFELRNEKGVISENGDLSFWISIRNKEDILEGKFFVSGQSRDRLIIFEPDMPGDSSEWMENKFIPDLLRDGYSIFCVRHRGTKLDSSNASHYINCQERIERSKEGSSVLGQSGEKKEYSVEDIANEPKIATEALHSKFKQLYMIGHSNGAAGIAYSLPKLSKEITDKVRNFISLAGFIGAYDKEKDHFDAEGRFDSQKMKGFYEYSNQYVSLGDLEKNVELQKNIFTSIHNSSLPENINIVLVSSPKDEYIPLESAKQYQEKNARGLRIVDNTQYKEDESKPKPDIHDLPNLYPSTLLRLLKIYHPKRKHSPTFEKREP